MLETPQIVGSVNNPRAYFGGDENLLVEFYTEPVHMEAGGVDEDGKPLPKYVDKVFIRIDLPGAKSVVKRLAKLEDDAAGPSDKLRWRSQWEAFERKQTQKVDGTPLETYPELTKAQVANMKAANIHTVEALAGLADRDLEAIGMGGRATRAAAKAYLDNRSGSANVVAMAKEMEALKEQIAALMADKEPKKKKEA